MESSDFKIIKRFGPSVLKVKIPENIIKILNSHFDNVILDKDESKRLNHGEDLVGDVTQELKLEKEIMEKVLEVAVMEGTVNFGMPLVGAGIISTSKGAICGRQSTGVELGRVEEALKLF